MRYVKPHGALYNAIVHHEAQAAAVVAAVRDYSPELPVLGLPGSAFLRAAEKAGLRTVREFFVDRGYTPEGTLVPRPQPGAVLHDPDEVTARVLRLVADGVVTAVDGSDVAVEAESACVHGDSPGAVEMAPRGARRAGGGRRRGAGVRVKVLPFGDAALLVEVDGLDEVLALAAAVRAARPAGVLDVVPAARTVLVTVAPGTDLAALRRTVLAPARRPVVGAATAAPSRSR